jgi:hypothetical protein
VAGTDFTPGTVLAGRFVLDDLLDENHGASLWRATDRTLVRSVAVHLLADSDERAQPLLTAARTSALVSDGRLLRVLDAAAGDGMVYVVNEWGSGVSLDRLLADGPLSPRRAAWVVREVAEAISNAHRHGVCHGRLLPQNVMISEAGSVKLVGFVVDAVLHSGEDEDAGGDEAADVRNLGALLYAALVGRWPGTSGSTIPDAPTEHGRPLRPRRVRAGVPRPLDAICERVLNAQQHASATPIESAHEVWAALSDYIGDPGAAAVETPTQVATYPPTDQATDETSDEVTGELDTDAGSGTGTDTGTDTGTGTDGTGGTERLLVAIGDVCGKGARAAARTGLVRDVLRVLVRGGRGLAEAVRLLNEVMMEAADPLQYCTLAAALVRRDGPAGFTVELLLAGHERPVLVRADGRAEPVGAFGTAVGLLPQVLVEVTTHRLEPGDALLLYTDGVTERRRGAEQFGPERLLALAARTAGKPARQVVAAVRDAVERFSPEPATDDVALVAVRARPD